MENTKKKINLEIAGSKITVVTDEEQEYVEKLAELISQKVNAFAPSGSSVGKTEAALVCALTLLDENFKLKIRLEEMKNAYYGK